MEKFPHLFISRDLILQSNSPNIVSEKGPIATETDMIQVFRHLILSLVNDKNISLTTCINKRLFIDNTLLSAESYKWLNKQDHDKRISKPVICTELLKTLTTL